MFFFFHYLEKLPLNTLAFATFESFSPKRTFQILWSPEIPQYTTNFPCFHLLKIIATFMLYLSLKFLMLGHLPYRNRDDIVRVLENPWTILIRHPMLYTDILLLISGYYTAQQLSEEIEQKSFIPLLKRVSLKFSRYSV